MPASSINNSDDSRFPNNLPPGWKKLLAEEATKPYFQSLTEFLKKEYQSKKIIYPARENILRAIRELDYDKVKVVILGQDPYHGPNQAIGLSFAVPNSLKIKPPSLMNIFKEIQSDLEEKIDMSKSDLSGWAHQGVLLLNTVLTVRAAEAFSHREKGWEIFTDKIISSLNERKEPIIFLLWGSPAQKKSELIKNKQHFILKAPHPSPLSAHRGFLGCQHFSKTNSILKKINELSIDWTKTSL
ncbi:MAG: uracil-DNA glycosylase [Deltaproteobacteria bacterium]|nr:uracil-DNA glycosylase [Deltaproteobacteria bacterium]